MKRAGHRRIWPNKYAGVGGRIELGENPLDACYREIEEETGLTRADILTLELLYITIRQTNGELRHNYHFFGTTTRTDVIDTNEGQLMWVDENELLELGLIPNPKAFLTRYLTRNAADRALYVGVSEIQSDCLNITFIKCEDFER